jgi:Domain of unknown function (DUF4383)
MNLVKTWAALVGVVLIAAGLVGFANTPLVGSASGALVATDNLHNIVHLATGALALFIAFGLSGRTQADAMLGFGILYTIIFVAVLLSPTLFGLFSIPANTAVHLIHVAVAVVSLGVGFMARNAEPARI